MEHHCSFGIVVSLSFCGKKHTRELVSIDHLETLDDTITGFEKFKNFIKEMLQAIDFSIFEFENRCKELADEFPHRYS